MNVYQLLNFIWMILKAQMQTVDDKTIISSLSLYASDQYGLLITDTVGGDGGDFSQTMISSTQVVILSENSRKVWHRCSLSAVKAGSVWRTDITC